MRTYRTTEKDDRANRHFQELNVNTPKKNLLNFSSSKIGLLSLRVTKYSINLFSKNYSN